jgi:hypothetical protein
MMNLIELVGIRNRLRELINEAWEDLFYDRAFRSIVKTKIALTAYKVAIDQVWFKLSVGV